MFDLALTEFAQIVPPMTVLREVFRDPLRNEIVPGSPQSITRCAILIPAPATLERSFTSVTRLIGPL